MTTIQLALAATIFLSWLWVTLYAVKRNILGIDKAW